MIYISL